MFFVSPVKDTNTIKYVCISPQKVEHVGRAKSKSIGQDALRVCWIPTASQVPHLSKAIPPTHALHGRNLSPLSVPMKIVPLWNDDLLVSLFHLEFGKLYINAACMLCCSYWIRSIMVKRWDLPLEQIYPYQKLRENINRTESWVIFATT